MKYTIRIITISLVALLFTMSYLVLKKEEFRNVIFITVDTLRADHLPCYGYEKNTAPNICKLAEESVIFKKAIGQAPWTVPAFASIMTGAYPHEHGAIDESTPINDNTPLLAELLKEKGYLTAGFVSHLYLMKKYGFARGLDSLDTSSVTGHRHTSSKSITDLAIDWLKKHHDRKFFLWLHYFDPHADYLFHEDIDFSYTKEILEKKIRFDSENRANSDSENEIKIALYDGEIVYTDYYIGKLLNFLEEEELYDNSIIIFVADHGEGFGEHGVWGHDRFLHQERIHVPLTVYVPGKEPGSVSKTVETKDIFYTVLDLLGGESEENEKNSLLNKKRKEVAFSAVNHFSAGNLKRTAVISGKWKMIWSIDRKSKNRTMELFNLEEDPLELTNIFNPKEDISKELESVLLSFSKTDESDKMQESKRKVILSGEEEKALRSLGYLK